MNTGPTGASSESVGGTLGDLLRTAVEEQNKGPITWLFEVLRKQDVEEE